MKIIIDTKWLECLEDHEDDVRLSMYEAIFDYMSDKDPNIPPELWMVFNVLKPFLDEDRNKRLRMAERSRQNGSKGGRKPQGEAKKDKPKKPTGFRRLLQEDKYKERCERLQKLDDWIERRTPYIFENLEPLTQREFDVLIGKYTIADICDTLEKIENRKDLRKRYKNLYLTLLNWLKNGNS